MKELVERVARAICLNRAAPACKCKDDGVCKAPAENLLTESNERLSQSRAAIRAVLSHFSEPGSISPSMRLAATDRHNTIGGDWSHTIASAMRAALSELQAKEAGE